MEGSSDIEESVPYVADSLIHPGPTGDFSDQRKLYDEIVAPHEEELAVSFRRVRDFVDEVMDEACQRLWMDCPQTTRRDFENKDASPLFGYPDGCCLSIVEETLRALDEILEDEAPYLVRFIENGGVFAKRWGAYRTSQGKDVLQNFIQIGDRVWDVAFEEMEPGESRKVAVSRISDGKYRNFATLAEAVSVTEKYYPKTRHYPSVGLLGWMGTFHSNVVFHEPTGYLMRGGGNLHFSYDEVLRYLTESADAHPSDAEAGMLAAVEDALAFRRGDLSEISTFVLEEIHSHLSTPVKRRSGLPRLAGHAKHFYERQAQRC